MPFLVLLSIACTISSKVGGHKVAFLLLLGLTLTLHGLMTVFFFSKQQHQGVLGFCYWIGALLLYDTRRNVMDLQKSGYPA
jgi:hypothetical protein